MEPAVWSHKPYPGWPYRPLSRMGLGWKGIRPKKDQAGLAASRAAGVTGAGRSCWDTLEAVLCAWLKRDEQQVPGAVCPQRFIRADSVTSCLCSSCCPHTDTHRALRSIRNRSKKAIIYQEWTVTCLPGMSSAERVLQVLFLLMSDTLNLCCMDVAQGPAW